MELKDFMNDELIVMDLDVNTKEEAIKKLTTIFANNNIVTSQSEFENAVLSREKEFTTGVGLGVSIPHGKDKTVNKSCFAFAKLKNEINWNSLDGQDVKIIFMLAIMEEDPEKVQLKMLSSIAVGLMDEKNVEKLKSTNTIEEVKKAVEEMLKGE